ncbi:DUF4232 domain-containing protein [Streptomyces sp. NPDC059740]|uniref:DUF4232 domain-containing protein n=1 Tax=Streptomyces sp. NPDC059740 TaxID=3346926 RepID=UPI00364AFEEF
MRVKKVPALALIVAAAGLSLTACNSNGGANASADTGSSTAASSSAGGQGAASGSSAEGKDAASGSTSSDSGTGGEVTAKTQSATSAAGCKTDDLGFSATSAGVKNEIVVNMKNNGSRTCSMHGFPGVQLIGPDGLGDTGPDAARTDASGSTVTIAPSEETRFLLHYSPESTGSTKTYTRLSVTPPNERVSEIVNLGKLSITLPTPSGQSPDVFVDPVGYHTGSGK